MILYTLKCPKCKLCFEKVARHQDRDKIRCPACRARRVEPNFDELRIRGHRVFIGKEAQSYLHGFHPDDVAEARKALPGWDIHDDGTVTFKDRGHYRSCMKERAAAEAREAQQEADSGGANVGIADPENEVEEQEV